MWPVLKTRPDVSKPYLPRIFSLELRRWGGYLDDKNRKVLPVPEGELDSLELGTLSAPTQVRRSREKERKRRICLMQTKPAWTLLANYPLCWNCYSSYRCVSIRFSMRYIHWAIYDSQLERARARDLTLYPPSDMPHCPLLFMLDNSCIRDRGILRNDNRVTRFEFWGNDSRYENSFEYHQIFTWFISHFFIVNTFCFFVPLKFVYVSYNIVSILASGIHRLPRNLKLIASRGSLALYDSASSFIRRIFNSSPFLLLVAAQSFLYFIRTIFGFR